MITRFDEIKITDRENRRIFCDIKKEFVNIFTMKFERNGFNETFDKEFPDGSNFDFMSICTLQEIKKLSNDNMLNIKYAIAEDENGNFHAFSYCMDKQEAFNVAEKITKTRMMYFDEMAKDKFIIYAEDLQVIRLLG